MSEEPILEEERGGQPEAEDADLPTFDITMKKKKKKKAVSKEDPQEAQSEAQPGEGPASNAGAAQDTEYSYKDLLSRVFTLIREHNPDATAGERKKFTIVPPVIAREGSKKTAFGNIVDFCRRMNRPIDHLTAFLLTELGTTGNMDGAQRLIIKGRFQQLQVESVLKRYIQEYVTCRTCRAPETKLEKDATSRLLFMECEKCGSRRSVALIKTGFKAQTGKRSAMRTA